MGLYSQSFGEFVKFFMEAMVKYDDGGGNVYIPKTLSRSQPNKKDEDIYKGLTIFQDFEHLTHSSSTFEEDQNSTRSLLWVSGITPLFQIPMTTLL
jgi:hypothetical protein